MKICAPCFLVLLTLILDEHNLSDDNLDVRADCNSTVLKSVSQNWLQDVIRVTQQAGLTVRFTAIYIQDQKVDSLAD